MKKNKETIKRYKKLDCNFMGRDLIIGDLHGSSHLLDRQLDVINFDPSVDRVISVGDLVDRGVDSLKSLSLLKEPWFHAVISNHEAMMLTYFDKWPSSYHRPMDYIYNGGEWVNKIQEGSSEHADLMALLGMVEDLPLVLVVSGDGDVPPFNVTHADLTDLEMSQKIVQERKKIDRRTADSAVWSRLLLRSARLTDKVAFQYGGDEVVLSEEPLIKGLHLTYVGHNILKKIFVHHSHVFIDRGAYRSTAEDSQTYKLQMVEHRSFARSLSDSIFPTTTKKAVPPKKIETIKK